MSLSPAYREEHPVHKIHDTTRTFASFASYKTKPTSMHISGQEHTKVPNILQVQKMPHVTEGSFPFKLKTLADDVEVKRLVAEARGQKKQVEGLTINKSPNRLPHHIKSLNFSTPQNRTTQRSPNNTNSGFQIQQQLAAPGIVFPTSPNMSGPTNPSMAKTQFSSTQQWRNRVICQTENRRRKNGSNSPTAQSPSPSNEIFRGSLNPKEWRNTQDTEELGALLQPHEYPHGRVFKMDPKERFQTHNAREFQNKSINKVPLFSNADACRLRHTIDTNSPAHIDKNPIYTDTYNRLYKQINVNQKEAQKKEEFMTRTRCQFMMTSAGNTTSGFAGLIGTPDGNSPNISPRGGTTHKTNVPQTADIHRKHMMETHNQKFYKSPSPDCYRDKFGTRAETVAANASVPPGTAGQLDLATTGVTRHMNSIDRTSRDQNNTRQSINDPKMVNENSQDEKQRLDKQRKVAKYAQMQKDRLKSHYGGMFNSRDRSQDIAIDEILRSTLQRPFDSENWINMQDELLMNSTQEVQQPGNESPRMLPTSPLIGVQKDHMAATQKLRKKCQQTHGNFHQTHLDTYPFRNGLKKVSQKRQQAIPQTKQKFLKQLEQGQQQISFWSGLRIQGPIGRHELRESPAQKLQANWYKDGFWGPKH